MAKKTVQELRETVLSYGFAAAHYSSLINHWIDEAQRTMFRQANIRAKETEKEYTTESTVNKYALPENYGKLVSVRVSSSSPPENLIEIDTIEEFDELDSSSGTPEYYIINQGYLYLYPTPSSAQTVKMRYWIVPSAIAAENSANPSIAEDYIYLIEEYCLFKAYAKEGDIEMSNFHKALFDRGMIDFVGEMNTDSKGEPEVVDGAWPLGYF